MTDRRLSVLALVPYPLGAAPGQRYRIEQWAPHLRDAGVDIEFVPFAGQKLASTLYDSGRHIVKTCEMLRSWFTRFAKAWRWSDFDAIYLYREAALIGPAIIEHVGCWQNRRLLYDFDDAIWLGYVSPKNRYLSYLKAPGKTRTICRLAAAVTVGSDTLADFARRYNPAVTVIPSTVSLREYRQRPSNRVEPPTVGWTGSHSSLQYLQVVEPALKELARRRQYRLLLIGVERYTIDGVNIECRPWRASSEVEDLWSCDVGIMPLFDDPWARGKCAMKAIQYMGVGLPTVVSPVGANTAVVQDGVNGFHAATDEQWVELLDRLLADVDLRQRLGMNGRRRVEEWYSAEVQAPRLAALLRSLCA